MKTTAIILAAALAACAPQKMWVKNGNSWEQHQRDEFECRTMGTQLAYNEMGHDGALLFGNQYIAQCMRSRGYELW
jgi:hypothetical protein